MILNRAFIILIIGLPPKLFAFTPEKLEREVLQTFFNDHSKISQPMLAKVRASSLSCQVELRNETSTENCRELLQLWEDIVGGTPTLMVRSLNQFDSEFRKKARVRTYVTKRSQTVSGTVGESSDDL